jgi:dTDP-glucose pyrophosphorylase
MMKAVILAAGAGTRLRPLTYTTPKPLTAVAGKPVLEWILEAIGPHVDGVVLIVGHLREKIEAHFGSRWGGLGIRYVHQAEQRGTGHALQLCREALAGEDRFFVIYGDNISAPEDMARCTEHDLSALAVRVNDTEEYGIFQTDGRGQLIDLVEKPKEFVGDLANAGVYVLDQRIFEDLDRIEVSERREIELTDAVLALARRAPLQVVRVEGPWLPIGVREDIPKAERVLAGREAGAAEFLAQRRRTLLAALGLWHHNMDAMLDAASARGENQALSTPGPGETTLLDLVRLLIGAQRCVRGMVTRGSPDQDASPTPQETPDLKAARSLLAQERESVLAMIRSADEALLDRVCTVPFGGDHAVHLTTEELIIALLGHESWHAGLTPELRNLLGESGH